MKRTNLTFACLLAFGCGDDGGDAGGTSTTTPMGSTAMATMTAASTMSMETGSEAEESTAAAEGSSSSGGGGIDADAIKEMADDWMNFERINVDPENSAHGNAAMVNWYVPSEYAEMFRMLDPENPTSVVAEEGTLLVKEHLNADGESSGYTFMYKGPEGTDPDANDWFWGRVAANGNLAQSGSVGFCINCHAQVEASDYMFGVSPDNQQ